jgi:nonsense-mediated mRNA decay protein 3
VAKESDLGVNNVTYRVLTHLGHVLRPGDLALGYDLKHTIVNDIEFEKMSESLPDIVLVKKSYPDKGRGKKQKVSGRKFRKKKDKIYTDIKEDEAKEAAELLLEEGDDMEEEGLPEYEGAVNLEDVVLL